jgi:TonB family protein
MDHADDIAALPAGQRVERYQIEALLAQEPYGYLYRVRDPADQHYWLREFFPRECAMRQGAALHARAAEDRNALRWWLRNFLEQAVLLARLPHAGLERVLGAFEANGTGYWLCEAPAGEPLHSVLERRTALAEASLRRILPPVLSGLEALHGAGLLHRDIRPQNLILRGDDSALLVGVSPLRAPIRLKERTLYRSGVPPYAAPEEASPTAPRGPWTDLYALAATVYHALYGHAPDAPAGIVAPPPAGCSETLLGALAAALQSQPERRPQSVAEWRALLDLPVAGPGTAADLGRPAPAAAGESKPQRHAAFAWLLVPLLLGAAGLLYWRAQTRGSEPAATSVAPAPTNVPAAAAAATVFPAQSTATANAPAAQSAGPLDRLAVELMAKEHKAQEARGQQQALQRQREQSPGAGAAAETTTTGAPPAPSAAELEAAARAKALEQEVARLKAQREALLKAQQASQAQDQTAPRAPTFTLAASAYYPALLKKIRGAVQYPQNALRDQEEGTCTMRVAFARDGRILNAEETVRIGVLDLDRECREVFTRLGRLPPVPENVEPDKTELVVELPITFRLP